VVPPVTSGRVRSRFDTLTETDTARLTTGTLQVKTRRCAPHNYSRRSAVNAVLSTGGVVCCAAL
jgi:hypothetical protein